MHIKKPGPVDSLIFSKESLSALFDQRSAARGIIDFVLSRLRQIASLATMAYHSLTLNTASTENPSWREGSRGLVVMIHGLKNGPAQWHEQIRLLRNHQLLDVYTPKVTHRGSCSLSEAVEPILKTILDYAQKYPRRPICLIGASNGGRCTMEIGIELGKRRWLTPVKTSNIAGAHYGSSVLSWINILGISHLLYPKVVREELAYGSKRAQELLEKAQKPLPWLCGAREHEYYATTEDCILPDLTSTLPKTRKKACFHVLHGQSHDSIVSAIAKEQIDSCTTWIYERNKSWLRTFK